MKTNAVLIISFVVLICSCEEINIIPAPSVFRNWEEIEPTDIPQFEGSTITSLILKNDFTYQMTYVTWTDVWVPDDPCHRISTFYAKGKYSVTGDTIFFEGCASDPDCLSCKERCDGTMDYNEICQFKLTRDTLFINPEMNVTFSRVLIPSVN